MNGLRTVISTEGRNLLQKLLEAFLVEIRFLLAVEMTAHASFTGTFYALCFVTPTIGGIFFKAAFLVEIRFLPAVEMTKRRLAVLILLNDFMPVKEALKKIFSSKKF